MVSISPANVPPMSAAQAQVVSLGDVQGRNDRGAFGSD